MLPVATSSARDARTLASAYDLIVFPGHHEYVTTRSTTSSRATATSAATSCSCPANNFFWRVVKERRTIVKTAWRDLGRPEAALVGVQYSRQRPGRPPRRWPARRSSRGRRDLRRTGCARRQASPVAASRSTSREGLTPRHPGAREDPEPLRSRLHGADRRTTRPRAAPRSSRPARSPSPARSLRPDACSTRVDNLWRAAGETVMKSNYSRVSAIATLGY